MSDSYAWDFEMQKHILSMLLHNRAMLLAGPTVVKPDYFSSEPLQTVADLAYSYTKKYRKPPTSSAFKYFATEYLKEKGNSKKDKELMLELAVHCLSDTDYDHEFIKDLAYDFADVQNVKSNVEDALDCLGANDADKARDILNRLGRTAKATVAAESTLDYFRKTAKMPAGASVRYRTGLKGFDEITGGIRPKQYGVLVGQSGTWKTGWAVQITKAYILNFGLNILFISNEQSEHDIQCLLDCAFLNIKQDDRIGMKREDAKQCRVKVKKLIQKAGGRLFIKYFPFKSVSMGDVQGLIEVINAKMPEGERIDGVILDAVDGFHPYGAKDTWEGEAASYMALERLVGELDIFAWSTCQVGKEDLDTYVTSMRNMRGRAEKAYLASVIVAINKLRAAKKAGTLVTKYFGFICAPKTRNTINEQWASYEADTARMQAKTPSKLADAKVESLLGDNEDDDE